jgi:hypothetical protein
MPERTFSRTPPPEGTHKALIKTAEWQRLQWRRTPANPAGEVLTLRLDLGQAYALVVCDLPTEKTYLLPPLAGALGLEVDDLEPDRLVGLRCRVEIEHVDTRRGVVKPIVKRWLPREDAGTPKKQARNGPKWLGMAAKGDIPF